VPKPFKIDQDNLRVKCSALNVDFSGVRFDLLGWPLKELTKTPPYKCIKFGYTLQNARFLLLSSNLAKERLQTR